MKDITKFVIASSLSVGAMGTAVAGVDGPCDKAAVMSDQQLEATVGAGIENRPITPTKKAAAKKAPAKKAT